MSTSPKPVRKAAKAVNKAYGKLDGTINKLAQKKKAIVKAATNLDKVNAKAVAAHKKYDGPISADNVGKKSPVSKQSTPTTGYGTKKGSKPRRK